MSFNIKKTSVLSAVTAALLATCWGAQATGNTAVMTVTAEVSESTCQLTLPKNKLELGSYSSAAFKKIIGTELGLKEFSLELTDCGNKVQEATVTVKGEPDIENTSAFQNTLTGGAEGVAVLIEGGTVPAKVIPDGNVFYTFPSSNVNSLSLKFNAKLISTKTAVKAGKIEAPITFTVTYS